MALDQLCAASTSRSDGWPGGPPMPIPASLAHQRPGQPQPL